MSNFGSEQPAAAMILGEVASTGLAGGRAVLCDCATQAAVLRREVGEAEVMKEVDRFDAAIDKVEAKLLEIQDSVRRTLGKGEAEIFEAQILLLHDPTLRDTVRDLCLRKRINVEAAVEESIKQLTAVFERLEDPFFRERGADLRDVGKRLLDQLAKSGPSAFETPAGDCVIVTSELMSSVVAQFEGRGVRGLIVENGGVTAHATILARALGIPVLVHVAGATKKIRAGDWLILDALAGRIFVNPDAEIQRKYQELEAALLAHRSALKGLIHQPAVTSDGTEIKLCANIGQSADAAAAANVNADGIGLYRTEFLFLVQDHFPSEEEQYQFYRSTAEHLRQREIVIRVLDIGSDKPLSYFPLAREANPALGSRGTGLLLRHPTVLHTQLRAILRLSTTHPVCILFPMIGGLDDLRAAKAAIERAKASLLEEHRAFNSKVPVGIMVETPSAAILIRRLAQEADFLSVGTNDLVQYLLAADRSGLPDSYEPLHPAVLRVLSELATVTRAAGKSLSVCGEMASDPAWTALLLGLGFRSFSVSPGKLLEIKHAIRATSLRDAESLAKEVLALDSIQDVKARLRDFWSNRSLLSSLTDDSSAPPKTIPPRVIHNAQLQRFESQAGDSPLAYLSYTPEGDRVVLEHTFVPEELRGRGTAAALARAALDEARLRSWRIVPRCSYVASFIERNPEFAALLDAPRRRAL